MIIRLRLMHLFLLWKKAIVAKVENVCISVHNLFVSWCTNSRSIKRPIICHTNNNTRICDVIVLKNIQCIYVCRSLKIFQLYFFKEKTKRLIKCKKRELRLDRWQKEVIVRCQYWNRRLFGFFPLSKLFIREIHWKKKKRASFKHF